MRSNGFIAPALVCIVGLLLSGSTANATEYRTVHLINSRVLKAEIQGFTPEAVTLGIPQGTMVFKPEMLDHMEPLTEAEYSAQPSWRVVILDFTASRPELEADARTANMLAARELSAIPGIVSGSPATIPGPVSKRSRQALAKCKTDLLCALREGEAAGIDVVMMGQIRQDGAERELRLGALWVSHPEARKRVSIALKGSPVAQRSEIYTSQHRLLFLQPPQGSLASAPTPQLAPVPQAKPTAPPSASTLSRMAWAPIPGLPHLMRKDYDASMRALTLAGLGAAAGIGVAGRASTTRAQFVGMSLVSTYTFTVLANHLFGSPPTAKVPEQPRP
jgi:hypothetical protein